MTIKINRESLLKPLSSVGSIVERRHTLPILSNLLLEAKENHLTLTATDLEMQVSQTIDSNIGGEIATTVSAKKLIDICRSLPESSEIMITEQESRLEVKVGKSRFNLQTLPSKDYPLMTRLSGDTDLIIHIAQAKLKHLLKQVEFSMAQQDIRYYLNGLLFEICADRINIVGTDGHRLSFTSTQLTDTYEKQSVILPRKTVIELIKLLDDTEEQIRIELGANQVNFSLTNTQLISKIIDGKFPDYTRVIPIGNSNTFTVERSKILQSMHRASILSNEKFRGIRMLLGKDSVRLISNNSEQEEAEEELEVNYNGSPLDIGFNVTYMIDVLNNISSDTVTFSFADASSSCLVTVPGDDNYKYVVMPMRI